MKTTPALALPLSALVALAAFAPVSRAAIETVVINSDTTITQGAYKTVSGTLVYQIADNATFKLAYDATAAATQTVGPLYPSANASIIISPSGTAATGRFLLENLSLANGSAGFLSISSGATNVSVDVTNATFRNIAAGSRAGLLWINNTSAVSVVFKNSLFENIRCLNADTGVIRMARAASSNLLSVTSGTFLNNYSLGHFGVLDVSGTVLLTDVLFSNNRAGGYGGAIGANSTNYGSELVLTDVIFKDNWAGRQGGAIWTPQGNGKKLIIRTTGSNGVTNYEYTGNYTLGLSANAAAFDVQSGEPEELTPSAAGGGFYYASTTGTLVFDLAASTTLTIGSGTGARAGGAYDSIASNVAAGRVMSKEGLGALVLNADNSYYYGAFDIREGAVVLGNAAAKLGGNVNLFAGGTLAGTGTLATTHATITSTVSIRSGGVLQIGALATDSGAAAPETLSLVGALNLDNNAIIRLDLFEGGGSDRFEVNGIITQTSGTSIIDINTLITGTFHIGTATALATQARVTIGGVEQAAGARQFATLDVDGVDLVLIAGGDISRALTWTVVSGRWNTGDDNWAGSNSVTKFAVGDRVIFAPAASGTIELTGAAHFKVADMTVNAAGDLVFTGSAGIAGDPGSVILNDGTDPNRITDATGKLVKQGTGALVFENTGGNTFAGGIELGAGTLAFNLASQIDTTGTDLRATGNATLRADASIAALPNAIAIDAGATLTFDTQGHAVAHTGALSSGGSLVKTGAGALTLSGNSGMFTGATLVNEGSLVLDGARLGGAISLVTGATLAGSGSVAGALNAGAGSVIDIGLSGAASGTLAFGGILSLNGATLKMDLLGGEEGVYVSDQITAAGLALTTGTVRIGAFQSGTYTLGIIAGLGSVSNLATDLALVLDAPGRQSAALSVNGGDKLMLTTMADISRSLTWSGTDVWTDIGGWSGSKDQFASGDRVTFDATAPAAARTITLANRVYVADMTVSEDGYAFRGAGGITSGTGYISNTGAAEFGATATGKLVKTGAGTLTFENTEANFFEAGIDVGGGMIVFSNPNQLTTGSGAAIHFLDTGTLRAADASVVGVLDTGLAIADGKTAVLDTQGGNLAITGAISGGPSATFRQGETGGLLVLAGNSAGYAGVTTITGSALLHNSALGGTINVADGATFGGYGEAAGTVNVTGSATVRIGFTGTNAAEALRIRNLQLGSDATVTGHGIWAGAANVSGSANVRVETGKTISLDADVSGSGDLVKTGAGQLDVANGRLLTRRVLVQTGTLAFAGNSITVERLEILPRGVLKGVGVIAASGGVENAGRIRIGRAGGATIHGTLQIAGAYSGSGSIVLAIGNGQGKKDVIDFAGAISGTANITLASVETITSSTNLPRNLITRNGSLNGISGDLFAISYEGGALVDQGVRVTDSGWLYAYDPVSGQWGSTNDPIPLVPPATGMHAAALFAGRAALDSLNGRLDTARQEYASGDPRKFRLWLQGIYRHDKLSEGVYKNASNEITGAQAGVDWTCRLGSRRATSFTLGLFTDYAVSAMDRLRGNGETGLDSFGGGLYAQLAGLRWYVDAALRGASLDYTLSHPGERDFTAKGSSWSGALGAGFLIADRSGWMLEPRTRLSFQSGKVDDTTDSIGMTYRMDDVRSLEMRGGLLIWRQWEYRLARFLTPYVRIDLVYESKGDGTIFVAGEEFRSDLGGAGFDVGVGLTMQLTRGLSASAQASWADNSKVETASFNLGLSYAW